MAPIRWWRLVPQYALTITQATPIATTPIQDLPALPRAFFSRPAEEVAPELVGFLLVNGQIHRTYYPY